MSTSESIVPGSRSKFSRRFITWIQSSVGRKQIVAVTGLGFAFFAAGHMAGNLLLFVGPQAYNLYGHQITSSPIYYPIEIVLLTAIVTHVWFTVLLVWTNRRARPVAAYRAPNSGGKSASWASRTMILSGLLMLAFLVLHILAFRFGEYYTAEYNGVVVRDLYRLAVEKFRDPAFSAWYMFSMLILMAHLSHGMASTMQSLGFANVRNPKLRIVSWAFAIIVAGGFFLQPLYFLLGGGK